MSAFYYYFYGAATFFEFNLPLLLFFTLFLEFLYAFFIGKARGRLLAAVACCSLITWPLAIIFYRFVWGIFEGVGAAFWFFLLTEILVILAEWRLLCLISRESKKMLKLSAGMNAFSALFFPVTAAICILFAKLKGTL
ncbi:MAG: hypothetical protein LBG46_00945 [Elusimicrobiota bacterium]|jgi:hypothetical protein|nr:hypothetical protein [Elusimicrobiota bacterium]